jgi:hypothetical protein
VTYLTKDIRDHLTGSTAIVDAFSDRIFPEELRTSTGLKREVYPCILISDLTNEPEYALRGEVGLHTTMIQIDVWTDGTGGKQRLNELAELVRNRLSGYRGQFGTGSYGTAHLRRNDSLAAPPVDGSNVHRRRQSMDFEIIHTADVPTLT